MDQLRIKDLEVYAYHGVFAAEKELGQRFVLDLILDYDMTRAAKTGDLTASIHYGELAQELVKWCQESKEDLIETLAYQLIGKIFQSYCLVEKVSLEVKKPWAPVPLPLDTCSVKLVRQKRKAFIALGSNQGSPTANLDAALEKMAEQNIRILQASSRIETEPWGGVEQDILYIGQEEIYSPNLIVPHPYVAERAFVLQSLMEIAPHFVDPVQKKNIRQLWDAVEK